jgi:flagellar protein FlaG
MDSGAIASPGTIAAPAAPQRAETLASAGAVRTELPPEAAVQQADAPATVRFDPSDGSLERAALDEALQRVIHRRIVIDPKTREVVDQRVDSETGEVIRQVPDEAILKMRAFAREMRERMENSEPTIERRA